jgi:alanine dehydrogenase
VGAVRILRDLDIQESIDIAKVVERIEEGYRADARGEVVPFPRARLDAGAVSMAWLGGAITSMDLLGYRSYVYNSEGYDRGEQVVVLYGYKNMDVRAVFVGRLIGNLRTGASLAAALHMMAPHTREVGFIGTGDQARNALACIAAIMRPSRLVAWSPNKSRREKFRSWARSKLGVNVELAPDVGGVVRGVPAVVLATSAENTLVTSDMITVPKILLSISAYRRPEIDPGLLDSAHRVWTDSVAQASGPGTLFDSDRLRTKLRPLGEGVSDGSARDSSVTQILVNTGAAWEELLVAQLMFEIAESRGIGVSLPMPRVRPSAAVF